MEKGRTKTLHFQPTFTPRFPLKIVEIGKNKHCCGETSAIGPSKFVKIKALPPLPFPGKIRLLFTIFGLFFGRKQGGVTSQRARESKFEKSHFIHTIPVNFLLKKFWFKHFSVLRLWITKYISENF